MPTYVYILYIYMLPFQTVNGNKSPGNFPYSVYCLLITQTEVIRLQTDWTDLAIYAVVAESKEHYQCTEQTSIFHVLFRISQIFYIQCWQINTWTAGGHCLDIAPPPSRRSRRTGGYSFTERTSQLVQEAGHGEGAGLAAAWRCRDDA